MGKDFGVGFDYGSLSTSIKHNFNNAGTYQVTNSYATYLSEEYQPVISNTSLVYGTGRDGDYSYRQFEVAQDFHYTSGEESSCLFDLHAGVDASVNHTFKSDTTYDISYGTNMVYVKDKDNNLSTQFQYGPQYSNNCTRTDNHTTFDVGVNAGVKLGIQNVESNNIHVFANLNQEVTNKRNTVAQVGLGGKLKAEALGTEITLFAKGGYQHNFNSNTTHNWSKHSGAFITFGAAINL